jgi:hypothetical protein
MLSSKVSEKGQPARLCLRKAAASDLIANPGLFARAVARLVL